MNSNSILSVFDFFFFFFLLLTYLLGISSLHGCCAATDSLKTGGFISLDKRETLVSADGKFELGFYSPDEKRSTWYIGIRYPLLATLVWVANRDHPIAKGAGGLFGIKDDDGSVALLAGNNVSCFSAGLQGSGTPNRTLRLLDTGNLVLIDDGSEDLLWQSFSNPTDTFLPGMKMDSKLKLTSWRNGSDPRTGHFVFQLDVFKSALIQNGSTTFWKTNGFSLFYGSNETWFQPASTLLFNFAGSGEYNHKRIVMNSTGEIQFWNGSKLEWSAPGDQCSVYKFCGRFGSCNDQNRVPCRCLPGYVTSPEDRKLGQFWDACSRKTTTWSSGHDTFVKLKVKKVAPPSDPPFDQAENEADCKKECVSSPQCKAYAYDIPLFNPRGGHCWIWNSELFDVEESFSTSTDLKDIFLRVAASDVELTSKQCETCGTTLIPYPLSTGPNCGDPTYSGFSCNDSIGQLSFKTPNGNYSVVSIDPETHSFVVQLLDTYNCSNLGGSPLLLNQTSPFQVSNACHVTNDGRSPIFPYKGGSEVEIVWKLPPEPICNSPSDCKDWPNSSCNISTLGDAKRRCLCNAKYNWNGSSLNCTQEAGNASSVEQRPNKLSGHVNTLAITIPVISGVLLLCIVTCLSYKRTVSRRRESQEKSQAKQDLRLYDTEKRVKTLIDTGEFKEEDKKGIDVPFFDLKNILDATNYFSDEYKLGQGGFGPVYKGFFPGGQEIAVKRLSTQSMQGLEEFKNEVVLIAKLQHRNLVRLVGYCIKADEKILLYEYMKNKSLDAFIFDRTRCLILDWRKRFEIILGIARGLLYLHQDSRLRIIHRDLKTSNILLDEEMNPKISDFGLARIVGGTETEANTRRIVGTYGYMSPEYALDGQFSIKSDVFSFGVIVLEIIGGKRNTGFYESQPAKNLIGHAWKLWNEEKACDLMDQALLESCDRGEVLRCINVGLLCVQEDPGDRPTMSNVVFMLGSEIATLPTPKHPAFVVKKWLPNTGSSCSSKPEIRSSNELTVTMVEEGR